MDERDIEILKKLEESLWRAETRFDKEYMESILAPNFIEFGRSGKVYERKDTLSVDSGVTINTIFPLKDFKVRFITYDVALVTYISEVNYETLLRGNRSSIWKKYTDGIWKLEFHQGTPL